MVMKFHILWSVTILCLARSEEVEVCSWKRLTDPCHPLGQLSNICLSWYIFFKAVSKYKYFSSIVSSP